MYQVELTLVSPCDQISNVAQSMDQRPMSRKAYLRLQEQCETIVKEEWHSQVGSLLRCVPPTEDNQYGRFKRWLGWLTAAKWLLFIVVDV